MEHAESAPSGIRLGRYVLEGRLASGGMSEIFRAHALGPAGVNKTICIKRVAADVLHSERAVARFVEEARLSMKLDHGNIVTVFDFGRAEDGYYLAMEWVDGVDLATLLVDEAAPGAEPLSTGVVAHVGAEIARALQHAHEHEGTGRIVHRDVKPSNVLLSRAGEVKLGDFGIAIVVGDDRVVAGTRGYMAPEQARGEPVGPAADLFGLGRVLLELAKGRRVALELSRAALETLEPSLAAVVRPMLAEKPADRPPNARQVAIALERLSSEAIARGEPAPRDVIAARVERARSARPSPIGEARGPTEFESFALTETNDAITPVPVDVASRPAPHVGLVVTAVAMVGLTVAIAGALVSRVASSSAASRNGIGTSETTTRDVGREATPTRAVATAIPSPTREPVASTPTPAIAAAPTNGVASSIEPRPRPATPRSASRVETPPRASAPAAIPSPPTATSPESAVASGRLSVAARPWARVFVDDRGVGVTPVLGLEVPAGTHRIRFENEELGITRVLSVDVPANGRRNVSIDLE